MTGEIQNPNFKIQTRYIYSNKVAAGDTTFGFGILYFGFVNGGINKSTSRFPAAEIPDTLLSFGEFLLYRISRPLVKLFLAL